MSVKPAACKRRRGSTAAWAACLLLCACGGGGADRPRAEAGGAETLSPASRALSAQAVARLERKIWAETLEVPARIRPDERRSVQVTAPAGGRIESVAIKDFEQPVRMGDVLAILYSPELVTAQREFLLLDPKKEPALARKAEERLLRMGVGPDLVRSLGRGGAPAEKTPIASPRDGYVIPASTASDIGIAAPAKPAAEMGMGGMAGVPVGAASGAMGAPAPAATLRAGTYVERGAVLATINDLAWVAAEMALPASQAALFRVGDSIHLELREPGFSAMARLDFLAAQVADSSGNIVATAYLQNREGRLRPGLLGKAHLAPAAETTWVLPRAAVHDLGDRHIVWQRSAGDSGAFEAREVRVGRSGTNQVEILDGLPPGAAVAAQASLLVDPDVMLEPSAWPVFESIAEASPPHAGHPPAPARDGSVGQAEVHEGHAGPGEGRADSGPQATALLRVTADKARLAGIRTAIASVSPFAATRTFRAVMQWDARSRQTVASRAEGRILQVAVLRPGEKVARGQVLAYLESETAIAAQEEFLAILRNAPDLPSDLARAQTEASRRRLETFGLSPARIAGMAGRGRPYSSLPITSPRDGLLLEASARPGQYVSAGTALFSIGLADRVWAETWLLPDEVKAYPVGTEAWVRVEGLAEGPIPGRLEHIRQEASASGTVTLAHVGLGNAGGRILPGTQAWVAFRQPARKVLNLPGSALLRSSGMTEVWVETDPGAYAPRMVATGAEAGDRVEILSGIAPGEKVVVAGGYLLRSEWTLRQGAGMAHGGH